MTIKEMHYDLKLKLNKVDSQKNKNFLVPELDWVLNEAANLFVKLVAQPRKQSTLGFELVHRTMEDIKTLVTTVPLNVTSNIITTPTDYKYFVRGRVKMTKGKCVNVVAPITLMQHDDTFEETPFYKSSFEWRRVNGVFDTTGLRLFTDSTFTFTTVDLTYVKKIPFMHNAQSFPGGTYTSLAGVALTGTVDCILPEHVHTEIVDLAVLLLTGMIQGLDYKVKVDKVNLNQTI